MSMRAAARRRVSTSSSCDDLDGRGGAGRRVTARKRGSAARAEAAILATRSTPAQPDARPRRSGEPRRRER
eukprot:2110415-Rhodomonas_salina.2